MNDKINLHDVFENRQKELEARLTRARTLTHPTNAGDEGEESWVEVLRDFLPRRYDISRHRFVIDSDGDISEQQDIVIYDGQFAPTFLVIGGTRFIPIESVYAVMEVKPTLSKGTLQYAGSKAGSVRKLRMKPGDHRIHTGELITGEGGRVLAGILTHDSDWRPPFGKPFHENLRALPPEQQIDLGCVVREGAFSGLDEEISTSHPNTALIAFCIALFDALQKHGNAPGVDARRYGRELWGK